ncbi:MAG: TIGR00269 family protein [Thermoplasmata archaeon]
MERGGYVPMLCSRCTEEAVTYIRYSGAYLCPEHFMEFFEKRVYKDFRKQLDIKGGKCIAVAVSGGKDSLVTLHLLHDILKQRRDCKMVGITIDEGIKGYRHSSVDLAVKEYEKLNIDYRIVSFRDHFKFTLDQVAHRGMPCSTCGVLRRWLMNTTAKRLGADHLATGLNLDDIAQSILMNFCRGDVEKLSRMGPHEKVKEGLVPRLAPLRRCPENESYLYAMYAGIPIHDLECPYADEALRGVYRDVLGTLEDNTPGTKYAVLSSYDKLMDSMEVETVPLDSCEKCGEPTSGGLCKACEILESVRKDS